MGMCIGFRWCVFFTERARLLVSLQTLLLFHCNDPNSLHQLLGELKARGGDATTAHAVSSKLLFGNNDASAEKKVIRLKGKIRQENEKVQSA